MKKNVVVIIILILAVAIVVVLMQKNKKTAPPKGPATAQQDPNKPKVIKQGTTAILGTFPADLPIEKDITTTDSYKYIPAKSTEQQTTLEYVSKKSFAENVKIFSGYLASAGYKITNKTEKPTWEFLYGTKDNNDLAIRIEKQGEQAKVSVSYLKR